MNNDKCNGCPFCSDPEILVQPHYLKNESYMETRIITRCLATEHKYITGCVCADQYCKRKKEANE